jgi:uncharacterized protein YcaQ
VTALSPSTARRIALAAQGFGAAERGGAREPGLAQVTAMVRRLGLLQLDSVNVFCRAHYMPLFSRLGPYDTTLLDRISGHSTGPAGPRPRSRARVDRRLVEYWAHEASLIPVESHRLLRWRMANVGEAWGSMQQMARERPELVADTLALVSQHGPVRSRDTGIPRKQAEPGQMWNWHDGKVALEYLFFTGQIGAARRVNFERHYDLIERILPAEVRTAPTLSREDAERELIRIAARALGVAAEPDLGDYFRLRRESSRRRVAELVASGELLEVSVQGWDTAGYLWHEARRPRAVSARALLSPFDSLVFFRPRTERLFDFRYRIEIYTPAPKRIHGYYVLPFLLDERLVARVDLKSDRQAGVLSVQGAFGEAGIDPRHVAGELAAELELCAGWLGLANGVTVGGRGDLARALALALAL